ncbi:unnamed protein product [Spodoptera exigua]|nr:unnamed protein product [Spodoptera exigua]
MFLSAIGYKTSRYDLTEQRVKTLDRMESNDIRLGFATPYSKKIYSAIKIANPALWQREDDVLISSPNHELIDAVYITDLRPEKDGISYIEAGGIGSKTVTIALKSPSLLRGYKFAIEVYAQSLHHGYGTNILPVQGAGYPRAGLSGYGSQYPGYPTAYSPVGVYPNSPIVGKK